MSITRINSLGITDGTIVNGDINASAAIASTKLTGVNDAKVWVNFNGTGTPAIRASFNVTSITDDGTGIYTINFTNAMTDVNYCAVSGAGGTSSGHNTTLSTYATGSVKMQIRSTFDDTLSDDSIIGVAVFR